MTSSRLLLIFFVISAGYIFVTNFILTKSKIARSNGQHVYLQSALYGIGLLVASSALNAHLHSVEPINQISRHIESLLGSDADNLTSSAFLAIFLSLLALLLFQFPIYWYRKIFNASWVDKILEKRFKNKALNSIVSQVDNLWVIFQLIGWEYISWLEKKSIGNDHVARLLWEALSSEDEVIMSCDDYGKVFIGFVLNMPDPCQPFEEQAFKILPIMSGSLCKEHQQLHITTDYTESYSKYQFLDEHLLESSDIPYLSP